MEPLHQEGQLRDPALAGGAQRVRQACQSRDLEEDGEGGGLQGQEDLAEYERAFQVMVVVFVMVMMVACDGDGDDVFDGDDGGA